MLTNEVISFEQTGLVTLKKRKIGHPSYVWGAEQKKSLVKNF